MFYILKRKKADEFDVGDKVMVLADFPAVDLRAGTVGEIVEVYGTGVTVRWTNGEGRPDQEGFGNDELEYLAVQTECHPKVMNVPKGKGGSA